MTVVEGIILRCESVRCWIVLLAFGAVALVVILGSTGWVVPYWPNRRVAHDNERAAAIPRWLVGAAVAAALIGFLAISCRC